MFNSFLNAHGVIGKTGGEYAPVAVFTEDWVRNKAWVNLPITSSDEKIIGLHAVDKESNHCAFTASGDYTVDWGDGVTEDYNAGQTAYHTYDYLSTALTGTDRPVSFNSATGMVEYAGHPYAIGDSVSFYDISNTIDVKSARVYYVTTVTTDTFSISASEGGSPISFGVSGTAVLLPYKQAVVQITPRNGSNLTAVNLNVKHNAAGLPMYASGFLDIRVSAAMITDLRIGTSVNNGLTTRDVQFSRLECFDLLSSALIAPRGLLCGCYALRKVYNFSLGAITEPTRLVMTRASDSRFVDPGHPFKNGDTVYLPEAYWNLNKHTHHYVVNATTDTFQLAYVHNGAAASLHGTFQVTLHRGIDLYCTFAECHSLVDFSFLNTTNVVGMRETFRNCYSLQRLPLYDTSRVSVFKGVFSRCVRLYDIPLIDTSAAVDMSYMHISCRSLRYLPKYNTSICRQMGYFCFECSRLTAFPELDTSSCTEFIYMFGDCFSLSYVPTFDVSKAGILVNLFYNCHALTEAPMLNLANCWSASHFFKNCYSLKKVPKYNLQSLGDGLGFFSGCHSLTEIPDLNLVNLNNAEGMFANCRSLKRAPVINSNKMTTIRNMFLGCYSLEHVPVYELPVCLRIDGAFSGCHSLTEIPAIDISAVNSSVNMAQAFDSCFNLSSIKMTGIKYSFSLVGTRLSAAALDVVYGNLGTIAGQTITVSGVPGTSWDDSTIATAKGWTVVG